MPEGEQSQLVLYVDANRYGCNTASLSCEATNVERGASIADRTDFAKRQDTCIFRINYGLSVPGHSHQVTCREVPAPFWFDRTRKQR